MKKRYIVILLILPILFSACSPSISEPPPVPFVTLGFNEPLSLPVRPIAPVSLNQETYGIKQGSVCFFHEVTRKNISEGFRVNILVGEMLKNLGYEVVVNPVDQEICDLRVDLDFSIDLMGYVYSMGVLKNTCYTGLELQGRLDVKLISENQGVSFTFGEKKPPPETINFFSQCYQLEDNPLLRRLGDWETQLLHSLSEVWGDRGLFAIISILSSAEPIPSMQSKARGQFHEISEVSIDAEQEYLIHALANQSKSLYFEPAILSWVMDHYDVQDIDPSLVALVLRGIDQMTESKESNEIWFYKEIINSRFEFLSYAKLVSIQLESVPSVLMKSAAKFYQQQDYRIACVQLMASYGPEMIPFMIGYLTHYKADENIMHLATSVLRDIAGNGFRESVAEEAGLYLCYYLKQMEEGEVPGKQSHAKYLLDRLFPEMKTSSKTDSSDYYRYWRKNFQN